jgi:predicted GNAT family N-acyltransferase
VRIVRVTTPEQFAAALEVRVEVFVNEQGVALEAEHDALDGASSTVHVLALAEEPHAEGSTSSADLEGKALGTGRLLAPDDDGHPHIGRVAVLARARRTGVGKALMDELERIAVERYGGGGPVVVALSAQVHAIPFYERLGYTIAGEPYLDEGIWHRDATKLVAP